MSILAYLESLPFHEIEKRKGSAPADAIAFSGLPRKHPYDVSKFILFCDPLSGAPRLIEFKVEDILMAEDRPAPVSESGESLPLVRIWVKKGSFALEYEPFEVDDPPRSMRDSAALRAHLEQSMART